MVPEPCNLERAWDAWPAERYQRGETGQRPGSPATRSGHADHPPAVPAFRKLDAVAVLTARLLRATRIFRIAAPEKIHNSTENALCVLGQLLAEHERLDQGSHRFTRAGSFD